MPSSADTFSEPTKLANNLPARLMGEPIEEFKEKYGLFVNPVSDRAKYKHIEGKDQIRVYVSGVFDMFHFGHARYLMQAKNMFPNTHLICGVSGGPTTHELKGQTVFSQEERLECVRHCRYVDEVLCPSPWFQTLEFLKELNVDFTVQNPEPYPCGDVADIYQPLKDAGLFLPTIRTEGVSTSDFITRIISAYDLYLERNLQRGYTRHDLGINYLTEKRMLVARQVDVVSKKINGLIAGFVQYFYAPISDSIIQYMSPIIPELTEDNNPESQVFENESQMISVPNGNISPMMDDKIRSLCSLYLGWHEDQVIVEPLGKGCTNHVIIASYETNEWSKEVRNRNLSLCGDEGHNNNHAKLEDGRVGLDNEFAGLNNSLRSHSIKGGFVKEFDGNRVSSNKDGEKARKQVLIKLYGSVIPRKLAADVYVNCYLGSLGLVPKILGLFEGGRIEEYLPSTCITHENFRLQYRKIVKMIMKVHNLSMPVPREIFLIKAISEMSRRVTEDKAKWIAEADWFLKVLEKIGSDMHLAFCHNDVSMNNLLVPNSDPDSLVLIDWEYASYNYTLFDVANFCCQLQYDLSHPVAPNFLFNEQWLPCDADLLDVLRIYKNSSSVQTSSVELLKQLKFMIMGSELFWTLWALTLEVSFNIDLKDYLAAKKDSYFRKKKLYSDVIAELMSHSSVQVMNSSQLDNDIRNKLIS